MPLRWVVISVFALSSALNFLDRQILAAAAPQIMQEFHLSSGDYGDVILAFSLAYALAAPLGGWLIDRIGLNRGSSIAVTAWSVAGILTGVTGSLRGLVVCRTALGVAEGAGIPGSGKASAVYLEPGERALGSAVSQAGLTLGGLAAPLLVEIISARYGWRSAFVIAGALGFLWIPLWWLVAAKAPKQPRSREANMPLRDLLGDRRFWVLLACNILLMSIYSLWVNWTTVFLVRHHGMSQHEANSTFAWIPPIFATAGGFFGGWLSLRWSARRGIVPARLRVFLVGVVLASVTAIIPDLPNPMLATAGICVSFFACVAASANLYALPIDLFGAGRAAFCVSGLTSVYGLLQGVFSAAAGRVVDSVGFQPVCVAAAALPVFGYLLLKWNLDER